MHYTYISKNKGARSVRGKIPQGIGRRQGRLTSNGGFVALITAIILSIILITVTVALNRIGFLTRSEISDAEYKNRSSALAEACVDTALLNLALDPTYQVTSPQQVSVGVDSCWIRSVTTAGTQNTIETRAVFPDTAINQGATTNLRIIVNTSDLSIVSWDEIPSF